MLIHTRPKALASDEDERERKRPESERERKNESGQRAHADHGKTARGT